MNKTVHFLNAFRVAALVLPTAVLGVSVFASLAALDRAPTIRLPAAGYDPVDLLHGHYVSLTFDANKILTDDKPFTNLYNENTCLCFTKTAPQADGQNAQAHTVPCTRQKEKQCDFWVPNAHMFQGPQKFFVDERLAAALDRKIAEVTGRIPRMENEQTNTFSRVMLDVAMGIDGAFKIKTILIDGQPWQNAIKTGE